MFKYEFDHVNKCLGHLYLKEVMDYFKNQFK
jgi:hypothetical protein